MNADPVRLDDLIESVADGVPVNWDALTAPGDGKQERALRHLHLVAGVAAVHRSGVDETADTAQWSETPRSGEVGRWGHLQVLEKIGEGAYGEVYRARDPWLDREVALKLLKRSVADRVLPTRIIAEARALARLRHPNVVTVHGADMNDGRVGLWMELVRGRTLTDMLAVQGPFSASEAGVIGQELCRALGAVHAAGLIHRDVKAQNVMRESGGRLVLMDFGAGGTPIYLAPEVLAGGDPTIASDVYATGVLLYHLVTGRYPIAAASMNELADAHLSDERVRLSEVRPELPDGFVAVVERALRREPSRRYASVAELREALAPIAVPHRVDLKHGQDHGKRLGWRLPILAGAAAAVLAIAAASGWLAGVSPGPSAPLKVLAVLPFEDVSQSPEESHLATGMTMELTAKLGELSALRVIPWTFTKRFGSRAASLRDVVSATGADAVVEGSVQVLPADPSDPARRVVRIRVQLYRAGTESLLWTEAYERDLAELLVVQADIAQAIARHVNVIIERREGLRLSQVGRVRADAMDAYLRARELLEGKGDIRGALELFRVATERDESFAAAFAGLASCYALEAAYLAAVPAPVALERSLAASRRAIELDPSMPEAFATRGFAHLALAWDWNAAQADFDRARALGPNSAPVQDDYSNYLTIRGRHDEAIAAARFAEERAPLSAAYSRKVAWALYMARRYDEALVQLHKTLEIDPEYFPAHTLLGRVLLLVGRYPEAIDEFEKTGFESMRVVAHARAGHRDEAIRLLEGLRPVAGRRPPTPYEFAIANTEVGRVAEALNQLERAYTTRDASLAHLTVDPLLDGLRGTPQFISMVKRMSLEQ
jgi:TolB-like protein/tRNA A-37 threonylcarbamoyl transferase component Bud32